MPLVRLLLQRLPMGLPPPPPLAVLEAKLDLGLTSTDSWRLNDEHGLSVGPGG